MATITITEEVKLTTAVYRSRIDGVIVLEIDGDLEGDPIRINLNDSPIYEGDFETAEPSKQQLDMIHERYLKEAQPLLQEYRELSSDLNDALTSIEEILEQPRA